MVVGEVVQMQKVIDDAIDDINYANARAMFKTQEDWDEMIRYLESK
jgi:hypothetical protein